MGRTNEKKEEKRSWLHNLFSVSGFFVSCLMVSKGAGWAVSHRWEKMGVVDGWVGAAAEVCDIEMQIFVGGELSVPIWTSRFWGSEKKAWIKVDTLAHQRGKRRNCCKQKGTLLYELMARTATPLSSPADR